MVVLESGYATFETNRPINCSYILDSVLIEPTIRRVIESERDTSFNPFGDVIIPVLCFTVARDGGGKLISTIYPRFNGDNRRRSSMDHEAIIAIILSIFMIGNAVKLTRVFYSLAWIFHSWQNATAISMISRFVSVPWKNKWRDRKVGRCSIFHALNFYLKMFIVT